MIPETSPKRGLQITGPTLPGMQAVLTPAALAFLEELAHTFSGRVDALLDRRKTVRAARAAGEHAFDFLPATAAVRAGDWRIAPLPDDLLDRRTEITGPVDAKMIINALGSGAQVFMADFEDATSPTWANVVLGQKNLMAAVRGTLTHRDPVTGKDYRLAPKTAVLMVRPRGWHLIEKHVEVDGRPMPASLFDFGLFMFHNARALIEREKRPYFYLPKLEGHTEARLWNDVFVHAQNALGLPRGTIKATVLVETLPAAFEMDEILYELRDHAAGLNCGRWDYIFSFIKNHRDDPAMVLPDRAQITMTQPFMRAYAQLAIQTCHRRGASCIGGMAAQIPIKNAPEENEAALAKVRADKDREAGDGHDGTWVAHPALVPIAVAAFSARLGGKTHQLEVLREDVSVTAKDLLERPEGTITEEGLRQNIRVGIQYLAAWLAGHGCVPLYHLMEDAATAEISRTQIWQWLKHSAVLVDGRPITRALFDACTGEEMDRIRPRHPNPEALAAAESLFVDLAAADSLDEFLTLRAYEQLA